MAQIIVTLALYLVLVIPMGTYLYHIAAGEKTFADPVFNRVDNAIYKVCRITREGMNWKTIYITSFDDQCGNGGSRISGTSTPKCIAGESESD